MHDALIAAQRFCDVRLYRFRRFDLAVALFLEDFAALLLRRAYVRLAQRELLPDIAAQLRELESIPLSDCTNEEIDQFRLLVGRGILYRIAQRKLEMQIAQRIRWSVLLTILVMDVCVLRAAMTVSLWFMLGWCGAMVVARTVCVSKRHYGALFQSVAKNLR